MVDLFGREELRMLSWKQPFASLMLHGKIETRTRPTKYRGKVLIHATEEKFGGWEIFDMSGPVLFSDIVETLKGEPTKEMFKTAIAIGELVDCRKMRKSDEAKAFIKYDPERWCWIFDNVQRIKPFEIPGVQSWRIFDADDPADLEIINMIQIEEYAA